MPLVLLCVLVRTEVASLRPSHWRVAPASMVARSLLLLLLVLVAYTSGAAPKNYCANPCYKDSQCGGSCPKCAGMMAICTPARRSLDAPDVVEDESDTELAKMNAPAKEIVPTTNGTEDKMHHS